MNELKDLIGEDHARMPLRERLVVESRDKLARGVSPVDLLVPLKEAGLSLTESIWVLAQVSGMPLGKLKDLATTHPVWQSGVHAAQPLHDELERIASLRNEVAHP